MSAWPFPAFVPCNYAIQPHNWGRENSLKDSSQNTPFHSDQHVGGSLMVTRVQENTGVMLFWHVITVPVNVGVATMNTITFLPSLHLIRIIILPSRTWRSIKGNWVTWHPSQRITTSEAAPPSKSLFPLVPKSIFNDLPKRQEVWDTLHFPPSPYLQVANIQDTTKVCINTCGQELRTKYLLLIIKRSRAVQNQQS